MDKSNKKYLENKTNCSLLCFSFLFFIAIIKFGSPASIPEVCDFPMNSAEWLIFTWPSVLFPLFSLLLLIISLLTCIYNNKKNIDINSFILSVLWLLLTAASFSGFINSTCLDFPYMQCFYILGISTFVISFNFILSKFNIKDINKYIPGAIFWSSVLIILYGLYQYFFGFNETRNIVISSIDTKNISINSNFYSRLMQNYIFSIFSLTNTFAGYIILTLPLCIWFSFKYTKTKMCKYLFTGILTAAFLLSLFLSGSRSAILSLCISSIIIFSIIPFSKKIRFIVIFSSILLFFAGIFLLQIKGNLNSTFQVRIDYYTVALKLFFTHIFTGSGWGSFFYSYGFMKSFPSPEAAHTPHNFILYFFSQAGIAAGITALTVFLFPIIIIFKSIKKNKFNSLNFCIVYGLTALFFHMLLDVDFQVPSIILTAVLLCLIGLKNSNASEIDFSLNLKMKKFLYIFCIILIIPGVYLSAKIIPGRYYLQKLNNMCFPMSEIISETPAAEKQIQSSELNNLISKSAKLLPYSPIPWAIAGEYFLNNRDWLNAEICFKKAAELSPERASFYYNLSVSQFYQRKVDIGLNNLEKAKNLFPNLYEKQYIKIFNMLRKN